MKLTFRRNNNKNSQKKKKESQKEKKSHKEKKNSHMVYYAVVLNVKKIYSCYKKFKILVQKIIKTGTNNKSYCFIASLLFKTRIFSMKSIMQVTEKC